ncbi:N-acetylmuramoyl-L-alanine amidase [Streptomyces pathocidini]|uniref:N-acetylmuramoyl-L-alanine amidase n=2 Tax=Streptomyces pathocidini TaxID=1650571 RepID=A0ABW7UNT0_9ACTN
MDSPAPARRSFLRGGLMLATTAAVTAAALQPRADADTTIRPRSRARLIARDYPDADWQPASPRNYTAAARPVEYPIDFVVVHVAQETYDDTIKIFQNPGAEVSAHYLVRSEDGHVARCVREKDVGWHAGNWDYNTRSIGIEHEGWVDKPEYFTDAMYESSADLTAYLCAAYGIPADRDHIIGHVEVPGSDHTDPGPHWDWDRYLKLVKGHMKVVGGA